MREINNPLKGIRPENFFSGTTAKSNFVRFSSKIRKGWAHRKAEEREMRLEGRVPDEKPNAWFRRHAYHLIKYVIDQERAKVFADIVDYNRQQTKAIQKVDGHLFKMGLLAMFTEYGENEIQRYERQDYADQMLYAYRHKVYPKYLNGFIAMAGSPSKIREKLESHHVEPGFEPYEVNSTIENSASLKQSSTVRQSIRPCRAKARRKRQGS